MISIDIHYHSSSPHYTIYRNGRANISDPSVINQWIPQPAAVNHRFRSGYPVGTFNTYTYYYMFSIYFTLEFPFGSNVNLKLRQAHNFYGINANYNSFSGAKICEASKREPTYVMHIAYGRRRFA